jgi:hypothetical protein
MSLSFATAFLRCPCRLDPPKISFVAALSFDYSLNTLVVNLSNAAPAQAP